jgi:hypothetical protein
MIQQSNLLLKVQLSQIDIERLLMAHCCHITPKSKHSKAAIQLFFRNSECDLPIDY